jgi:hypothetical protein
VVAKILMSFKIEITNVLRLEYPLCESEILFYIQEVHSVVNGPFCKDLFSNIG